MFKMPSLFRQKDLTGPNPAAEKRNVLPPPPASMVAYKRYADWAPRLNKYITAERDKPFVYGQSDCCTFAAGTVKAMTGVDLMEEFRGKYWDEESANKALLEFGNGRGKLYRTLRMKLGRSVRGVYGRKGDVAFHDGSCGIVLGRYAIFTGSEGYLYIPITKLQRAFRIGE